MVPYTGGIAEAAHGIPNSIIMSAFCYLDDTLSAVINAWLDADKPMRDAMKKSSWRTQNFSNPSTITAKFRLTETQYARIRHGLLPLEMEDKWFVYQENGRMCFHRSWTGKKIFEVQVNKSDSFYTISEITFESDYNFPTKLFRGKDGPAMMFNLLLGGVMLGLETRPSNYISEEKDILNGWNSFGTTTF